MGILSRFKDIMSSNINALLDKAEDPEKMVDQTLRNLQEDFGKVKAETAGVMADEKRAKRAVAALGDSVIRDMIEKSETAEAEDVQRRMDEMEAERMPEMKQPDMIEAEFL